MTNAIVLLLLLFVASTTVVVEGRKRAARVRIGNHYKQHDAVHIIVNKVGYVNDKYGWLVLVLHQIEQGKK
jgi:hypothetical protein